jgi:hypothetical protein
LVTRVQYSGPDIVGEAVLALRRPYLNKETYCQSEDGALLKECQRAAAFEAILAFKKEL